ncbi:FIG00387922: hypothetical protein [hydrothermal vent metagenome]|uniref:RDD domain-containing protein n=1 Tax=hydrothermal vent metagenome TaxID=652676 RepID=A0A3B1E954_9ZZZZ
MIDTSNLKLASKKQRIYAFMVDDLAIALIVMSLLWGQIDFNIQNIESILMIINSMFIQIISIKILYQTFFIWYYGATIGKMILKIKVIDFDNFNKVSLFNALLRAIGRILSEMLFYIGFLVAFYTQSKQTFHDKMGRTLVINV